MAHSVHECKEMARVGRRKPGCYLATGHQRHYNILYARRGRLDPARTAGRVALHPRPVAPRQPAGGNDSWQQPLPPGRSSHEDRTSWTKLDKKSPKCRSGHDAVLRQRDRGLAQVLAELGQSKTRKAQMRPDEDAVRRRDSSATRTRRQGRRRQGGLRAAGASRS